MRAFLLGLLVAAALAWGGPAVVADTVTTDVGGDWHMQFVGGRGVMVLHLSTPQFGVFTATGAGYSTQFQTAFTVSNGESPQTLQFGSDGRITGTLALEDVTRTTAIGTLTVAQGTLNAPKDQLLLRCVLAVNGQAPRNVVLMGARKTDPATPLTGHTFDGVLVGRDVFSTKIDLVVLDERSTQSVGVTPTLNEGYPFFYFVAGGPVRVAGVERAGVRIEGLLAADVHGVFYGRVRSAVFGAGTVRGVFAFDPLNPSARPVFFAVLVMDDGRRMRLSGTLA